MSQQQEAWLSRIAQRSCAWSERWFPDAFAFAIMAVVIVSVAALGIGVAPATIASSFGDGFWSIIPFTMQMCFIVIGGYVTADSPPVARLTRKLATLPRTGRGAVTLVGLFSMVLSLLHWGLSLVLASLLARTLAQRTDLRMDYRAAGAAACLGIGSIWALGLSSSAAQLQANPASMPGAMLAITGVIPFGETLFLWQSMLLAVVLFVVSGWIAWRSAPNDAQAVTASDLGVNVKTGSTEHVLSPRTRPGEWLEYSPLLNLFVVAVTLAWLGIQYTHKGLVGTISNLNTYNLIFLMLGLLLQWRPRRFLDAIERSVPSVAGVLIQFPFLGAIAALMTTATNADGTSLSTLMSHAFTALTTHDSFAPVVGLYSAVLGLFIPSAGGKWLIEAPYVMQAANDLHYHLGWAVQIYNATEALANMINPFWMLPVLGMMGLKARDLIGFTFVQFIVHVPVVLFMVWLLGYTLSYHPPVLPEMATH